jgi:hypothetical protein
MNRELPARINPDAILEAIVEIRYRMDELPEIFMGRLVEFPSVRELEGFAAAAGRHPLFR